MAYTKTTWVTGKTPLSADNFNHIEDGIVEVENSVSSLLMVKVQEVTASISAGSDSASHGFTVADTVDTYTGYTPIGIVGWENNHALTCKIGEISLVGTRLAAYGANNGAATSLTIAFHVLYMKNFASEQSEETEE